MSIVTYPCKRCKAEIPFKDVHYANNGKDMICGKCYNFTVRKQLVNDKDAELQKTVSGKTIKEKYLCTKCRYNFTYALSEAALRCPLCSSPEVLKDDYNAQKLLQEAMELT